MLGYFCLPNHWVELVSDETTQLLSYSQIAVFLSPLQESDLGHFFSEIKVCIHFI